MPDCSPIRQFFSIWGNGMRLVRLLLKELWANPVLKWTYCVFSAGYIALQLYFFSFSFIEKPEPFMYLGITLRFVLVYLVFFLFFSYEYFGKTEAVGFSECASAVFCGKAELFCGQLCVLLLCTLPAFAVITTLNLTVTAIYQAI